MSSIRKMVWTGLAVLGLVAGAPLLILSSRAVAQTRPAVPPADDLVRVHGRVIDPAGRPVAGAAVMVVGFYWEFDGPLSQTHSGEDGSFDISCNKSRFVGEHISAWEYACVAATAPGFAPAWDLWDRIDPAGNVILQLATDDVPIEGRILDLEGQPVKGASVRLSDVDAKSTPLSGFDYDLSDLSYLSRRSTPILPGFVVTGDRSITTDAQGRFRIVGIGKDRTATLQVSGEHLAMSSLEVVTRHQETQTRSVQYQSFFQEQKTLYGANFDFTIEPGRVVTGTVRDAATGRPLSGVTVAPNVWTSKTQCITDEFGRYRIEGLSRKSSVRITAIPGDEQCYFMRDLLLANSPVPGPATIDFELHAGVWITGKVTDAGTGEPVAGTRISYVPYRSNSFVLKLPEYSRSAPASPQIPGHQDRYITKADGTYRIVGVPGSAIITAHSIAHPYRKGTAFDQIKGPKTADGRHALTYEPFPSKNSSNAMKEIDIAEGAREDARVDFQLDPGRTVHLTVIDPQGNALVGVAAMGDRPGSGWNIKKSANIDVLALAPDESRALWLCYMPQKIGKTLTIKPGDAPDGKMTVTLEPIATVTGRVVDLDGLPISNARMQASYDLPPAASDAEGRFKLMLLPGGEYHLTGIKGFQGFNTNTDNFTIKPGEAKNVGTVQYKEYR